MANRFLILIIGVLLGIIISGGIFWYLSGLSGKNIFIVNQQSTRNQDDQLKQKQPVFKNKKESTQSEKHSQTAMELKKSSDSLTNEIIENAEVKMELKISQENFIDTNLLAFAGDTAHNRSDNYEEQIVVKKDELLSSKNINLIDFNLKQNAPKLKKDSLAQISSGIKEPVAINTFVIEFWKSPINYKGYKMGRNKLVLFGLQETGSPKLYKISDHLFLKNSDKIYKIQKNTDFRSLELVSDPEILNLLNSDS